MPPSPEVRTCSRCKEGKAPDAYDHYEGCGRLMRECRDCVAKRAQEKAGRPASGTAEYKRMLYRRYAEKAGQAWQSAAEVKAKGIETLTRAIRQTEPRRRQKSVFRALLLEWAKLPEAKQQADAYNAEKTKALYWKRPDRQRQRTAAYKHANPDARERWNANRAQRQRTQGDGSLTRVVVQSLFAKAKACPYCGDKFAKSRRSLDHIEPLSAGGVHGVKNVVVCCLDCNKAKRDRSFADWRDALPAESQGKLDRLYRSRFGCEPEQSYLRLAFT